MGERQVYGNKLHGALLDQGDALKFQLIGELIDLLLKVVQSVLRNPDVVARLSS